ncbi:MAG: RagB/SusD family nutrient uptake outer membrane protein, partial [Muribaculaceae bacterium]|nr:RagB/SusD family nutrient uptake outer membrane protein [Muribaculaceae bacterium]
MKPYKKFLTLGAVLAGMASCTDLHTDLNTRYETLPDNPIAVEGEFNACYLYLHGWFGRDFNEGVVAQGDEVMGCCYGVGNYFDDGRYLDASIHNLNLDNWRTRIIEGCMSGVSYTNTKIMAYGGPDMNDPVVAPLRAIRAYYTFWMMELYGDAPIMKRPLDEGEPIDRSPRKEVAEWLESELLEILGQEDGLSKANDLSTYGKPNYWMAAALLAKIYLNWGVYTNDINTVTNDTPNPKLN